MVTVRPHAIEKSVRIPRVGGKNVKSTSKKFSFEKSLVLKKYEFPKNQIFGKIEEF